MVLDKKISKQTPDLRFQSVRKSLNMTQKAMADSLGLSHTAIGRYENGETEVSMVLALALEHVHMVNHRWLMGGEGPVWMSPKQAKAYASASHPLLEDYLLDRPLIQGAASCGPGGEIDDPGPGAVRYALRRDFAKHILHQCGGGVDLDLFFLRCEGFSMQPTIINKEIVLINTHLDGRLEPRNNAIYLVRRNTEDNEARVKRVRLDREKQQLVLVSDNRQYAPVYVDLVDDQPLHQFILGRVVWVGRYLLDTDPPASDW